jgi:predicted MFS family arabinose efflux permease
MVSNIAMGAGFSAFVTLLVPPYVTEVTGKAANAGIVMAVISLAAIVGPIMGGLADKLKAHRMFLNMGILGMAIAFVMFAFTAEVSALSALDSIIMGVSLATVATIAPVFIIGAGLSKDLVAIPSVLNQYSCISLVFISQYLQTPMMQKAC